MTINFLYGIISVLRPTAEVFDIMENKSIIELNRDVESFVI